MAEARALARTVMLTDPDTGRRVTLPAGSVPPDRLTELIRNPRAWAVDGEPDDSQSIEDRARAAAKEVLDEAFGAIRAYVESRGLTILEGSTMLEVFDLLKADDEATRALLAKAEQVIADTGKGDPQMPAELVGKGIGEVNTYLEQHPEAIAEVLAAEAASQARKGVLEGPHATPSTQE